MGIINLIGLMTIGVLIVLLIAFLCYYFETIFKMDSKLDSILELLDGKDGAEDTDTSKKDKI